MFSAKHVINIKMGNNREIGKIGENKACEHLIKEGYRILFRNYREKFDEIDIIARDHEGSLAFIEVKTLAGNFRSLMPEDNLTFSKKKKLMRACQLFANKHPELISYKGWRIDVVTIVLKPYGAIIKHYENIA